ncbi:MAG: hypothetical protein H0U69_11220, partial [Trueperaceae bacterium]|nr:hypothetical protein [Trueperaceae bacterium]
MQRLPPWLVSMFAGLFGAALLGALGAPSLVALLGGVAVGFVAHRSRRDPPWTAAGRRRWREGWHRGRLWAGSIGRAWQAYASRRRDPFGPGGGGRAAPPHGWP